MGQVANAPAFIYGTAWKEARTEALMAAALVAGFRAIDTANQRKHYFEAGVGAAVRASGLPREALWIQSKFTHQDGQDERLPYDAQTPIATQVEQSFVGSLEHLGVTYLDSLVLHGPSTRTGLAAGDVEAWCAMEAIHARGGARQVGISNVTAEQVEALVALTRVPIAYVQNRCYASKGWDAEVRERCRRHGITYQGFSLLTANKAALVRPVVDAIMQRTGHTREQLVFAFACQVGMVPLTGTSSTQHLEEDLAALAIELAPADVQTLERIGLDT